MVVEIFNVSSRVACVASVSVLFRSKARGTGCLILAARNMNQEPKNGRGEKG